MKTIKNYMFILILLVCLGKTILCDCPIQYYPSETLIGNSKFYSGFINADINFDPESQNT